MTPPTRTRETPRARREREAYEAHIEQQRRLRERGTITPNPDGSITTRVSGEATREERAFRRANDPSRLGVPLDAVPSLRETPIPPPSDVPLAARFAAFHADNPDVYKRLVKLARRGRSAGATKLGIGQLFEVLRWQHLLATRDAFSDLKLNNDYRAPYARLIMSEHPDLDGIFETRRSHVDASAD